MADLNKIINNYVNGIRPIFQDADGLYHYLSRGTLVPCLSGLQYNGYIIPGTYSGDWVYDQESGTWSYGGGFR